MIRGALAAVVVAAGLVGAVAPSAAAAATTLPMAAQQVAYDNTHSQVLIAGTPASGGAATLAGYGTNGALSWSDTADGAATGLVLGDNDAKFFVAHPAADLVAVYDAATHTRTATLAFAAQTCPTWLAVAGNDLWVAAGCSGAAAKLIHVDLATATSAVGSAQTVAIMLGAGLVAPYLRLHGGTLYATDATTSSSYTVSGATATVVDDHIAMQGGSCVDAPYFVTGPIALVPCAGINEVGSGMLQLQVISSPVVATGAAALTTPTFGLAGYNVTGGPGAVIRVLANDATPRYNFSTTEPLVPRGLASETDGRFVAAVTVAGGAQHLTIYPDVNRYPAQPTVTASSASGFMDGAVSLAVGFTTFPAINSPITVHLKRIDLLGTHVLPDVTLASSAATVTTSDVPRAGGVVNYVASWDGNATHLPGTSSPARITLRRNTAPLTIKTTSTSVPYNTPVTLTIHLGPTVSASRTLVLQNDWLDGTKGTPTTVSVPASGTLTYRFTPRYNARYLATFAGDARNERTVVSLYVKTGLLPTVKLAGYSSTSGSYRVYKRTVKPTLTTTFTPARSIGCTGYQIQVYKAATKKWVTYPLAPACFAIVSSANKVSLRLLTFAAGGRYRIRAAFSGDNYNTASASAWAYFRFL